MTFFYPYSHEFLKILLTWQTITEAIKVIICHLTQLSNSPKKQVDEEEDEAEEQEREKEEAEEEEEERKKEKNEDQDEEEQLEEEGEEWRAYMWQLYFRRFVLILINFLQKA